ncbi:uncharacterized protein LOC143804906 isoform X2 [Ranitomeya variabilis]|uniref:uncharacterized protein LOC143804906 isoform X2 n=1 Tax=Ranitomeya variabilis TaxID=490064 RepID=UPI004056F307
MEPCAAGSEDAGLRVHDQRSVLCYQAERNKRTGAWVEAVNLMHPHWDGADTQDHKTVLNDVKTEQPVHDRCKKRTLEDKQSALSPKAKKCPYYKELQFLLKTPELRQIQGNISPTSNENQQETQTESDTYQSYASDSQPEEDRGTSSAASSEESIPSQLQSVSLTDSRPADHDRSAIHTHGLRRADHQRETVQTVAEEIEKHPEVWDRSHEQYKGSKHDAWPKIVTALYPEWPNLPKEGKKMILDDVRKRWPSLTDPFIKSLKTPSGSSPPRKRVPFADQLQFILTRRSLRRTESNVYGQKPPDHEGDTPEHNIGEEVEDCRMVSQDSPGNMSSAGTSEDLTDTLGVMAIPANTGEVSESTDSSPASDAASSSGGGVSRHMGMGAASACPVALRRVAPKKAKKLQVMEIASRTLNLLDNSGKQDEHDKFGSLLADRLRAQRRDKQQLYMTAANCLLTAIDGTSTLPPAQYIMMGIFNIFNNPIVPPPPPAAASQHFGQAAPYRPDNVDAFIYGHTPVPTATGHCTSTPNSSLCSQQDLFPGYGYDPEFHQF